MAVNLHHLRYKIAAAAVLKAGVRRAARLPGARGAASALAERLQPAGEPTGSHRGIAATLLRQAVGRSPGGDAVAQDVVAGLLPAAAPEPAPDLPALRARADQAPSAGNLIAVAAALRRSYAADFEASAAAYEQALAANPRDLRAVEGVLVSGARSHYDWPRIWRAAATLKPSRGPLVAGAHLWEAVDPLFAREPEAETVGRAVQALDARAEDLPRLHQLLIETLAARLQLLGAFRAGARMRRMMAVDRVRELGGIPLESGLWLKHLLGALAHLEEDDRLARTAARPPVDRADPIVARQAAALQADAALWSGDPTPLRDHVAARAAELTLPGEERMRELVAGRRVAVVGPAAPDAAVGELIDSHDVVVRTNLRRPPGPEAAEEIGARTDIAYYAVIDVARTGEQIARLIEDGELRLAVTRPHALPFFGGELAGLPEGLRLARTEFGLYFRGAPMGVQRILYDLLQFSPAEISLFHADFYAGPEVTTAGYRDEAASFGPHSLANDPVVMHDLSFEFRFTRRLVRAGLVTPHGRAAEVLALDEEDYLARLETGPLAAGLPGCGPRRR
ncbi:hypothetical protein [Nesterenkonia halobia]|uniref:Uncharacterized protein n=1 Tax=Nesterenkonia halobia TaxID=37922 RepID=A0ABP6REF6_9MICC